MAGRPIGWTVGLWATICAGLAVVVAYQLSTSFPLAPTVTAAPPSAPILDLAERPAPPRLPDDDAVDEIVARPLFAANRRPYVAPPAPVEAAPEPGRPALPLELAGTFLTETDQAALILVKGETPEWLRAGQLIDGWQIEVVEHDRVRLRKGEREQVLQLREDVAAARPTGRSATREVRRDARTPRKAAEDPDGAVEELDDEPTDDEPVDDELPD